jgi:hypothetical protein
MNRLWSMLLFLALGTGAHAMTLEEATKAAERGDATAEHALSVMYTKGQGVPVDIKTGIAWLSKAAEHGDMRSQFELGVILYNGKLLPQDYARAFSLFTRAADQGDMYALYNLAVMHKDGQGTPKNLKKAFDLFSLTAENGAKNAQLNLCGMYMFGDAVAIDLINAYKWCLLSDLVPADTLKSNGAAAFTSHTAWARQRMSGDDMARAERLADEWLAKRHSRRAGFITFPLSAPADGPPGAGKEPSH